MPHRLRSLNSPQGRHDLRGAGSAFRRLAALLALLLYGLVAHAQVQRAFINPSFEMPFAGPHAAAYNAAYGPDVNWILVGQGEIPGWLTDSTDSGVCPAGGGPPLVTPYPCVPIELWFNGFLAAPAQGRALSELNYVKLYQNVCLRTGDQVQFNFAHRGRNGWDRAKLELGSTMLLDFMTPHSSAWGAGQVMGSGAGVSYAVTAEANSWARYSGTYTYTGPPGIYRVGFVPISTATGDFGAGNLLDDLNFTAKPYAEFTTPTFSVEGGALAQPPQLRFVGSIASPLQIVVAFGSAEAVYGTDYDFGATTSLLNVQVTQYNATTRSGTLTFSIPAGAYSFETGNPLISLPLRVLDDTVIENNEVISLSLPVLAGAAYEVTDTMTCGGAAPVSATSHTIIDNDVSLRTTKQVASNTATAGGTTSYTVTFANLTPAMSTSVAPLTAHDVTALGVADAVPANATFTAWTCTASGGASCPAASGSGAISAAVTLPVGGSLQFAISAVLGGSGPCTVITNVAQADVAGAHQPSSGSFPTGGVAQGVTLQGSTGFVVQPLQAVATTSVGVCATSIGITKTNSVTSVAAGGTTSYMITVNNSGSAAADGAVLRDLPSTGLACTAASCAAAGGAACPAGAPPALAALLLGGAGLTLPSFPGSSSLTFTVDCAVTASGH